MKFTKEQLAEALRNSLTKNGKKLAMSERTLTANVERLYKRLEKTDEETELEDVVKEYLPDYEELEGNYRKDNADFVKQWEKDHKKPDNDKDKEKSKEQEPPADVPDWAKALIESNKQLRDRLDAQDTEKIVSEKRSQIAAALKEKGIKNQKCIDGYIARATLNKDTDVEAEAKAATEWFNEVSSNIEPSHTPRKPGTEAKTDEHEFDDVAALMKPISPTN